MILRNRIGGFCFTILPYPAHRRLQDRSLRRVRCNCISCCHPSTQLGLAAPANMFAGCRGSRQIDMLACQLGSLLAQIPADGTSPASKAQTGCHLWPTYTRQALPVYKCALLSNEKRELQKHFCLCNSQHIKEDTVLIILSTFHFTARIRALFHCSGKIFSISFLLI